MLRAQAWKKYIAKKGTKSAIQKKLDSVQHRKEADQKTRLVQNSWSGHNIDYGSHNIPYQGSKDADKLVNHIAGKLHGAWQEQYKKDKGTDATRVKETKDEKKD